MTQHHVVAQWYLRTDIDEHYLAKFRTAPGKSCHAFGGRNYLLIHTFSVIFLSSGKNDLLRVHAPWYKQVHDAHDVLGAAGKTQKYRMLRILALALHFEAARYVDEFRKP